MEWIDVKSKLPMEELKGQKVIDRYMVTVYPKDMDPVEGPRVLILWFSAENMEFSTEPGGFKYEKMHDHFVSHWAELPCPAKLNNEKN